jgi:hypothetical protein
MGRVAGWTLAILLGTGCGAANARDRQHRWDALQGLAPGTRLEVQTVGQAGLDACRLIAVDDAVLTCQRDALSNWGRYRPATRMAFPRSAVRDVWAVEPEHEHHFGRWIRIGIETGLFLTACVGDGVIGGLLIGGIVLAVESGIAKNPLPPRPPRLHRRLIFHAP